MGHSTPAESICVNLEPHLTTLRILSSIPRSAPTRSQFYANYPPNQLLCCIGSVSRPFGVCSCFIRGLLRCIYGHLLGYVTVTTFGGGGLKGVKRMKGEFIKGRSTHPTIIAMVGIMNVFFTMVWHCSRRHHGREHHATGNQQWQSYIGFTMTFTGVNDMVICPRDLVDFVLHALH